MSCNVVNPGKIFHSNSIGSPSIVSKGLYCGEFLNQLIVSSQTVLGGCVGRCGVLGGVLGEGRVGGWVGRGGLFFGGGRGRVFFLGGRGGVCFFWGGGVCVFLWEGRGVCFWSVLGSVLGGVCWGVSVFRGV